VADARLSKAEDDGDLERRIEFIGTLGAAGATAAWIGWEAWRTGFSFHEAGLGMVIGALLAINAADIGRMWIYVYSIALATVVFARLVATGAEPGMAIGLAFFCGMTAVASWSVSMAAAAAILYKQSGRG
jgi:hypothetical protein